MDAETEGTLRRILREELAKLLKEATPPPVLLKPPAAAKRIGVSTATIWRWIRTGEISTVERGGSRYITMREIERLTEEESTPRTRAPKRRALRTSQPSAADRAAAARERARLR